MIVVDASVFVFSLLDEGPTGDRCRGALAADDRWIAPEHWMVEVLSVIRGNLLGGKISATHAADAVDGLARIDPVVPRTRVLLPRMWELRGNVTTYDAAYVAAAEAYGCTLLTTDGRLSRASGLRCAVDVID
ncbi:type II toxin-antitoxin system VapC family toxin [Streptomyces sp. H10-C2]|uniref:type II toxin-antitoxin system VapC family toxin n=1 Tax=unclassified Streptomyces TaxID=2593676 RepID=UPI0024BB1E38|nr:MULTISPECIES: type II toxin-antitoxin system VapC family toxin [unclassified Streptomyces]MDJ0344396.1 type II toxin-antitoxin system VapC family toxin [Streptomyces sp. PH10-H1]MDJ0373765.1 type II toxin-antitoxin system VapC family toxin [Streptomyces sp. H10-C2]